MEVFSVLSDTWAKLYVGGSDIPLAVDLHATSDVNWDTVLKSLVQNLINSEINKRMTDLILLDGVLRDG